MAQGWEWGGREKDGSAGVRWGTRARKEQIKKGREGERQRPDGASSRSPTRLAQLGLAPSDGAAAALGPTVRSVLPRGCGKINGPR